MFGLLQCSASIVSVLSVQEAKIKQIVNDECKSDFTRNFFFRSETKYPSGCVVLFYGMNILSSYL
jgi:hypothetical protein